MPDPPQRKEFVAADGALAERWCHVHLMELTVARAVQLQRIHATHRPDECFVHLQVAAFLVEASDA